MKRRLCLLPLLAFCLDERGEALVYPLCDGGNLEDRLLLDRHGSLAEHYLARAELLRTNVWDGIAMEDPGWCHCPPRACVGAGPSSLPSAPDIFAPSFGPPLSGPPSQQARQACRCARSPSGCD